MILHGLGRGIAVTCLDGRPDCAMLLAKTLIVRRAGIETVAVKSQHLLQDDQHDISDVQHRGCLGQNQAFGHRYKVAAGKQNPVLAPDENGFSLIDIMDDEPTKRAFRDGVNPENLGKMFAEQFDITKMGFE